MLVPPVFQHCFVNWVRAMTDLKVGEVVALDGTLHGCAAPRIASGARTR